LAASLQARAALRRIPITAEEARAAYDSAPLTPAWELSCVPENGRVRIATRLFIERGYHPEQITPAMTDVALSVCIHPQVASEAVAAGVVDGMALREGTQDDDD
jgi:hypothetical protein